MRTVIILVIGLFCFVRPVIRNMGTVPEQTH